jgi:hypothetical protein
MRRDRRKDQWIDIILATRLYKYLPESSRDLLVQLNRINRLKGSDAIFLGVTRDLKSERDGTDEPDSHSGPFFAEFFRLGKFFRQRARQASQNFRGSAILGGILFGRQELSIRPDPKGDSAKRIG